ncbi:hypothetical protein AKJ16_DCAP08454 [Drosera capensis]
MQICARKMNFYLVCSTATERFLSVLVLWTNAWPMLHGGMVDFLLSTAIGIEGGKNKEGSVSRSIVAIFAHFLIPSLDVITM